MGYSNWPDLKYVLSPIPRIKRISSEPQKLDMGGWVVGQRDVKQTNIHKRITERQALKKRGNGTIWNKKRKWNKMEKKEKMEQFPEF